MRIWLKDLFVQTMPERLVERARELANILPPRFRYGRTYDDALRLMLDSEKWHESDFLHYQEEKLEKLIAHCYNHIPYYKRTFHELDISIKDIQSPEDLRKLPLLDKATIRQFPQELIADNIPFYQRGRGSTSGSTGSPLTLRLDESARAFERALSFFHLLWLGWKASDKIVYLNPRPGSDPTRSLPALSPSNELRLTFRAMDDERMAKTVRLLQDFKPDIISAWPSSLYLLARWMDRQGKTLHSPRFLVTSSENLYSHVREFLENFYQAGVVDFYGQEESVVFAMQCKHRKPYHLQNLLSIPELIPTQTGLHELVGTTLHNYVMPLLRYRTGDLVRTYNSDCECGRPFPIIESIEGRESDFVVTPENKTVSPLILNYCFHSLNELRESQIVQEDRNTLRVIMVPWHNISSDTTQKLLDSLRKTLESDSIRIILEQRNELTNNYGCKTPFIVSHIDLKDSMERSS